MQRSPVRCRTVSAHRDKVEEGEAGVQEECSRVRGRGRGRRCRGLPQLAATVRQGGQRLRFLSRPVPTEWILRWVRTGAASTAP